MLDLNWCFYLIYMYCVHTTQYNYAISLETQDHFYMHIKEEVTFPIAVAPAVMCEKLNCFWDPTISGARTSVEIQDKS